MEHGAKECVEEQSRRETAIAIGVRSTACIDTEMTTTNTKEEPGLAKLVKSERGLLVKEEVVEDGWRDMDRQPCLQATYKPAITTSMNVVAGGVFQDDMKVEWADSDMDVGPTVLQHMDAPYRPQPDVSIIKQEGRSEDNNINPTRCSGVKEDTIEEERRADTDAQRSDKAAQSGQRVRSLLYSCDKCARTYTSKKSLTQHYRNLHSTESHECNKCNKTFPSRAYLYKHNSNAHGKQQYECAVCKKICSSKGALHIHVYRAHRVRPAVSSPVVHPCDHCHKTYASHQGLVQHIDVVHTKVLYRCSECNLEFKGKHLLHGHMKRVHLKEKHETATMEHGAGERVEEQSHTQLTMKTDVEKAVQSTTYMEINVNFIKEEPWLEDIVKSEAALLVKEEVGEDGWQDIAEQRHLQSASTSADIGSSNEFARIVDLGSVINIKEEHGAIDIGPTVLQKIDPQHTTNQKDMSVVKPELTINQDKIDPTLCAGVKQKIIEVELRVSSPVVYTCDDCHKIYATKQGLVYHIDVVHTKALYRCSECNKEYKGKRLLQRHIKEVHSREKHEGSGPSIYICDYCKKKFTIKSYIQRHIATVHASRSYKCDQCTKIFKCKAYLRKHTAKVHTADSRTHACDYCQKTFCTKTTLKRHTKNIHVAAHTHRCRRCNRNFKSSCELQQHNTRIHAQYKCEVCLRLYTRKFTLRRHCKTAHNSKDLQFQPDLLPHEMADLRPSADDTNAAASTSAQQHNVDVVKEEPAGGELELGPVVLQHMDCRPYEGEPQDGLGGLM